MGNRSITKTVVCDVWFQERWTGGGPLPQRMIYHICQTGGERLHEVKNIIKPQKTDKYAVSPVQSILKKTFQLNLEEDEWRDNYVGKVTQGADKRSRDTKN